MRFPIRPGKVTCAGIVAIFMVLPNSIWKGPDATVTPLPKRKIERMTQRPVPQSSGRPTTYPSM
jgi:hypothetical protein